MAKQYAFIEYAFIFDPSESWQHLHQFESSLSKIFFSQGFEAQIIRTAGGQVGKHMMILRPVTELSEVPEPKLEGASKKIEMMRKKESKEEFRKKGGALVGDAIKKGKRRKLKYDKGRTMRNKVPSIGE